MKNDEKIALNGIESIIKRGTPIDLTSPIAKFLTASFSLCQKYSSETSGVFHDLGLGGLLAAIFDLSVTAAYAQKVGNNGWLFCRHVQNNSVSPLLLYPFVNACPRCSAYNKFYFTPSKKPESAIIGKVASVILGCLLNEIVGRNSNGKCRVSLLGGNDLVDAIIQEDNRICFLEIKASPLVTFPLATETDDLLESIAEGTVKSADHKAITAANLSKMDMNIFLPLSNTMINIGPRKVDGIWPYDTMLKIVEDKKVFQKYVTAWKDVYDRYSNAKPKTGGYWLSNGCGQPVPRPENWPARRVGSGYESISDSKSSVGMDRTDDIKKGIYQVLKLGTHYKEFTSANKFSIYTALISNMHAVKHHDDYLKEFADLVWTIDAADRPYKIIKDKTKWHIPVEGLHNLYDALFAFTSEHTRDPWLKSRLSLK